MISTSKLLKRTSTYVKATVRAAMTMRSATLATQPKFSVAQSTQRMSMTYSKNTYSFSSYPKHTLVTLPALSPTMTEGRIAAWHIKVGQKIQEGDNIFDVQTDKDSVPNVYQEGAGYIAKILVGEGEMIPTNTPVVVVVKKEADVAAFADFTLAAATQAKQAPPAPAPAAQQAPPAQQAPAASTASAFPKFNAVLLPALSPTMTEGRIAAFHVKVGDKVAEGDNIFDVQTDKDSVPNIYQESSGFVAAILVQQGEMIPANHPVCIITSKKDDVAKFQNFTVQDLNKPAPAPAASKPASTCSGPVSERAPQQSSSIGSGSSSERVSASPYARKVAAENNVNLSNVTGSGPNGRVIAKDVLSAPKQQAVQVQEVVQSAPQQQAAKVEKPAAQAPPASAAVDSAYERLAITPMRRVIAERLVQSKTTIPHFYLTVEIQMDEVLTLRKVLNESSASKISVNDLIVKASALALRDLPGVNSQWHGDHIRQFKHSDVAVAVSTKTGLITPIVAHAETLGLSQISSKTKELAEKARSSSLQPHEYQGGTFTISNLGMYGVDSFSAIVNPPHGTILAVGTTNPKVVPDTSADAKYPFKTIQSMSVTLSCDHRVVDGALGAQWLQKFRGYLEKPLTMLL